MPAPFAASHSASFVPSMTTTRSGSRCASCLRQCSARLCVCELLRGRVDDAEVVDDRAASPPRATRRTAARGRARELDALRARRAPRRCANAACLLSAGGRDLRDRLCRRRRTASCRRAAARGSARRPTRPAPAAEADRAAAVRSRRCRRDRAGDRAAAASRCRERATRPSTTRVTARCWQYGCGGAANTKPGPPSPTSAPSFLRSALVI